MAVLFQHSSAVVVTVLLYFRFEYESYLGAFAILFTRCVASRWDIGIMQHEGRVVESPAFSGPWLVANVWPRTSSEPYRRISSCFTGFGVLCSRDRNASRPSASATERVARMQSAYRDGLLYTAHCTHCIVQAKKGP